jgi:metal-sulfur cluster biosynthetic enzyme
MFRLMIEPNDAQATDGVPVSTPPAGAKPADVGAEPPPSVDQIEVGARKVKDPELNLNIIDLGLVYRYGWTTPWSAIDMTLTSPGCPAGPQIMGDIRRTVRSVPGVDDVVLNLIWTPFWTPDRIGQPRASLHGL